MALVIAKRINSSGVLFPNGIFDEVTSFTSSSGQQAYTTPGTYSWTAPVGVTSVSVVAIGPGATNAGGGGGLTWANGLSVTPGQTYTVVVGAGDYTGGQNTVNSSFNGTACVAGGGGSGGGVGGRGGTLADVSGAVSYGGGSGGNWGGGAGGYAGNGGVGYGNGNTANAGANGSGGGGGGGGNQLLTSNGAGGGTGIYGQGSDGVYPGGGGSGGATSILKVAGLYGGGGAYSGGTGAGGAVRIIWGAGRAFPSTNTADVNAIRTTARSILAAQFDETASPGVAMRELSTGVLQVGGSFDEVYFGLVESGLQLYFDVRRFGSFPYDDGGGSGLMANLLADGANGAGVQTNAQNANSVSGFGSLGLGSDAWNLDGTTSYFRRNAPNVPAGTGDKTIICWCKPNSTAVANTYSGLVAYGGRTGSTPSDAILLSLNTTAATWYVSSAYWSNDYVPNDLAVDKDAWNMVGIVARGAATTNNTTLFCGKASGLSYSTGSSNNYTRGLDTTAVDLTIGCTDLPGRYFKGNLSTVLIYNRALTNAEIQQNFDALKGRYI